MLEKINSAGPLAVDGRSVTGFDEREAIFPSPSLLFFYSSLNALISYYSDIRYISQSEHGQAQYFTQILHKPEGKYPLM